MPHRWHEATGKDFTPFRIPASVGGGGPGGRAGGGPSCFSSIS